MNSAILRIAIPTPLRRQFDYLPPKVSPLDTSAKIHAAPGMRVRVPFGKTEQIGIITAITQETNYDIEKLKHAIEILDPIPLFSSTLLELIEWASQYYYWPLGEVFDCALPSWLKKGRSLLEKTSDASSENSSQRETIPPKTLNNEQMMAANAIMNSLSNFQVHLLEGVTGSGKTEVYFQAIDATLKRGLQSLVLVPEIGLAPQMLERLKVRFNVPIAVLHSSISEKKRFVYWEQARLGTAPIIVGTRSAAFVPLKSPGLFIVDEEHDPSFKQQDGFRYHARDLIIMRARLEQCPVVLGSATPSLETLQNAHRARYSHLRLLKRAGNAQLPSVKVIDIRHKQLDEGLSGPLIQAMRSTLERGEQTMLFLNRRGFAPILMCFDCGYIAECAHCDAKLTLHQGRKRLCCHHCEGSLPIPSHCPKCHSANINPLGIGTERLEAALTRHFPNANIVRIDRDSTRKKGALQVAVESARAGDAHILLGTQMIAKGHHFPGVSLVAVIDIDNALFSSDFRSTERLGQLLTQVAGRAGREEKPGICLLQTCHPHHPYLEILLKNGYSAFSEQLLADRRNAELPPFSYQALIRAESRHQEAIPFLQCIRASLSQTPLSDLRFLGPIPATMERKAGIFRAHLLIQSSIRKSIQKGLEIIGQTASTVPQSKRVRWIIDVDPIEIH